MTCAASEVAVELIRPGRDILVAGRELARRIGHADVMNGTSPAAPTDSEHA